jgi:von Willebrand factor type D domain/Lectin C-type domain
MSPGTARATIATLAAVFGLLAAPAHAGPPGPPVPPPPTPAPTSVPPPPPPLPPGLRYLVPGMSDITGFTGPDFVQGDLVASGQLAAAGGYDAYFAPGHGARGTTAGTPLAYPEAIVNGRVVEFPLDAAGARQLGGGIYQGQDVFVATCNAGACDAGARSLTQELVTGGARSATGPVGSLYVDSATGNLTVTLPQRSTDPFYANEVVVPRERAFTTTNAQGTVIDPDAVARAGLDYDARPRLSSLGQKTLAELDALNQAGKNAGELGSTGAEPGGLDFNTALMLGIAGTRMVQNWIDRGSASPSEAIEFGALTYGAARVPALGHGLGALFVADVAANSYGRNTANLLNALTNPGDPALRDAVRSGQIQADDFVPGLRGNPAYDAFAWFYDHAAARFAGVPLPARYNQPPPPKRNDWNDFLNGLNCLATQGCVGRRLGLNPGSSWGDPHVITGDGLQYDFQAAGEFVLVEADDLEIQVRQEPQAGSQTIAFNTAVAARVGSHRVGVYTLPSLHVLVDGQLASGSVTLGSDGSLGIQGGSITIVWAAGDTLQVQFRGDHLDVVPALTDDRRGRTRGLYGSLDGDRTNDLALPDGTPLVQPVSFAMLYGAFADGWRITQAGSLFDYTTEETTATFTIAGFPRQHVSTASLTDDQRAAAEATCRAAGVTDAVRLEACILDVGLSGNPALADGAAAAPTPVQSTADDPRPPDVATEMFGGHIYAFVTQPRVIAAADAFCRASGMTLASISSADESAFLITAVRRYANAEWFTGGKYDTTLAQFTWSDGTPFAFTAWQPGEPNNIGSFGSDDCITLNRFTELTWNDSFCGTPSPFVCEVTP